MDQFTQELIVRCKSGVWICSELCANNDQMRLISEHHDCVLFPFEDLIVIQEKQKIIVHDYQKNIGEYLCISLLNLAISSQRKYLTLIDKVSKDLGDGNQQPQQFEYSLQIIDFKSLKIVHKFTLQNYNRELWPLIKFSQDDRMFFYMNNGKLECLESETKQLIYSVNVQNSIQFKVQPTDKPLVCCYNVANFDTKSIDLKMIDPSGQVKFDKKFAKTSELDIIWSPNGDNLLFQKGFHEDASGQSYFGSNQVLQFDTVRNNAKELPVYDGPVHDVKWSQKSTQFILVSGYMPSGSVLYSSNGRPEFEFGKDYRNKAIWSSGRFVIIAGFGNLDGSLDVWDITQRKKITTTKYKSASLCTWSPCGRHYLCAKVSPRMNVDNQYSIFNYHGEELIKREFNELYHVQFRPSSRKFPDAPPSPRAKQQEQPKKPFVAFTGDSAFAQQLKAMKQTEGARVLKGNETFASKPKQEIFIPQPQAFQLQQQPQQPYYPPGYVPPEVKKKKERIRKPKEPKEKPAE